MYAQENLISRNVELASKYRMMTHLVNGWAMWSDVYHAFGGHELRHTTHDLIDSALDDTRARLRDAISSTKVPHMEKVARLKSASLVTKNSILRTMTIIPVSVGAAFLGVSENDLRRMKHHAEFGDKYLGRHCYSLDELLLMAQHPGWLGGWCVSDREQPIALPSTHLFEHAVHVDIEVATAFTDTSGCELSKKILPIRRRHRYEDLFRLSDVKKIHFAQMGHEAAFQEIEVQSEHTNFLAAEVL